MSIQSFTLIKLILFSSCHWSYNLYFRFTAKAGERKSLQNLGLANISRNSNSYLLFDGFMQILVEQNKSRKTQHDFISSITVYKKGCQSKKRLNRIQIYYSKKENDKLHFECSMRLLVKTSTCLSIRL